MRVAVFADVHGDPEALEATARPSSPAQTLHVPSRPGGTHRRTRANPARRRRRARTTPDGRPPATRAGPAAPRTPAHDHTPGSSGACRTSAAPQSQTVRTPLPWREIPRLQLLPTRDNPPLRIGSFDAR